MSMELQKDKLSEHLTGLENEIKTNPEALTLNVMDQSEDRLQSTILQLRYVRNSRRSINRMAPDMLYNIFKLAIYSSDHPDRATVAISSVCRHWRRLALGWPALWGFVDLKRPMSAIKLFMSRSKDAPLSLSWTTRSCVSGIKKLYFESCASSILPRLCSLTLHAELGEIQHVFQDTQLPPFRLQHLDFKSFWDETPWDDSEAGSSPSVVTDVMQLDTSCLRELKLEGSNLPWLQLPHNKLTHFKLWYPSKPPTLSQLLSFLSNCPLLCELEFGMRDYFGTHMDVSTNMSRINRLDFPHLKKLILALDTNRTSVTGFNYITELSACIQTLGPLSQFYLSYGKFRGRTLGLSLPFNIFAPVPSGAFSHFGRHQYLFISLESYPFASFAGLFQIRSAPSVLENDDDPPSYSLSLSGFWPFTPDHAPVLELIDAMPEITYLVLYYEAWKILTSWNIDIRNVFPGLNTLELLITSGTNSFTEALNSLPPSLRLKTLILGDFDGTSSGALLDAVSRIGVKILKLRPRHYFDSTNFLEALTTLRQRGIVVLRDVPAHGPRPRMWKTCINFW